MARGFMAAAGVLAALCLLLTALPWFGEAARLSRSMADLEDPTTRSGARLLQDESRSAQLRFEAGDPLCGSFRFHYRCFDKTPLGYALEVSTPKVTAQPTREHEYRTPSATTIASTSHADSQQQLAESAESRAAQLRFQVGDTRCGRFGDRYKCLRTEKSLDAASAAPIFVDSSALQAFVAGGDPYDCGPLGKHKYRCGDIPGGPGRKL